MAEKRFTQAVISDSYSGMVTVGGKVWWTYRSIPDDVIAIKNTARSDAFFTISNLVPNLKYKFYFYSTGTPLTNYIIRQGWNIISFTPNDVTYKISIIGEIPNAAEGNNVDKTSTIYTSTYSEPTLRPYVTILNSTSSGQFDISFNVPRKVYNLFRYTLDGKEYQIRQYYDDIWGDEKVATFGTTTKTYNLNNFGYLNIYADSGFKEEITEVLFSEIICDDGSTIPIYETYLKCGPILGCRLYGPSGRLVREYDFKYVYIRQKYLAFV
jgi:hypothetical protein